MSVATETTNYYEGMFLIHSGRFASDSEGVTKELMEFLEKSEAEVVDIVLGQKENWRTKSKINAKACITW